MNVATRSARLNPACMLTIWPCSPLDLDLLEGGQVRDIAMLRCGLELFINSKKKLSKMLVKLVSPNILALKGLHDIAECHYHKLHEQ